MENEVDYLLDALSGIDGVLCVAIIDNIEKKISRSRNINDNCNVLASTMSDIVRANVKYSRLSSKKHELDDVLISYNNEIHLLKPLVHTAKYFIYIGISRDTNLALTRIRLNEQLNTYLK
ncbi:hypothetical protein HV205_27950 [Klebsiella sp. RHBSTW-00465]|uniref:hypothetical protein n=1 Tax=Klebsiella sp. RHBSTW-00465 TaxID=2742650 RepID=UPI0015F3CFDC|nr:hypothetical protein [Klebsiella sp. RHBSTW-00465]MBA7848245.1 hypothetical protein [Klebsiella sp. RHBSTW-00465]